MKFLTRILAIFAAFLMFLNAKSAEEMFKDGVIRIGYYDVNNTYLADDEILKETFDYEKLFAARLARNLSLNPKFIPLDTNDRIPALEKDLVDVVIARFTITNERAQKVDFCEPYMKTKIGILALKDSNMTSIDDYKDKKVIAIKDSTAQLYLERFYPQIKLIITDDVKESFDALENGEGDAFASDSVHLYAVANVFKQYAVFIDDLGDTEYFAAAVKKGNKELLKLINQEMIKLKNENFFKNHFEMTLRGIFGKNFDEKNVIY